MPAPLFDRLTPKSVLGEPGKSRRAVAGDASLSFRFGLLVYPLLGVTPVRGRLVALARGCRQVEGYWLGGQLQDAIEKQVQQFVEG